MDESHGVERSRRPRGFRSGLIWGIGGTLAAVVLVPLAVAVIGVVDVSAQRSLGPLDALLDYASGRSVAFHAKDEADPFAGDPKAIADALPHYREMCVTCHGAPGLDRTEIAAGLHPQAPDLASEGTQAMTDGELYWVIANGIGSTGMPAFEKADDASTRWKIVAFVRHLPELTDAERDRLRPADAGDHQAPPDAGVDPGPRHG